MPATIGSKPPEVTQRKSCDGPKITNSCKSVERRDSIIKSDDLGSPGGGEITKKSITRKRALENRKSGCSVTDRIPKAKAQRAKGSIALNKAIEKGDTESQVKNQTSTRSSERLSRPNTREGSAVGEARRMPPPVRVRSKARIKVEEREKVLKKRKPWMSVEKQLSNETVEEKTVEVVEEVKPEEIKMNPPSSSCSFFEKLQQGVKAYFSSRNSFTPADDKNKKRVSEGGIRTRGRVAKGVKEDHKKRKPRKVVKNKKNISEGDLQYERFRVESSLGGQSNNSLSDKPKFSRHFQMLKRKKLYCPIKHCVRIQIPRKGYFYRSTVRFKAPGSASSVLRVDSSDDPKSQSKVQISGMASTGPKKPDLLKKGVKSQKDSRPVSESVCLRAKHSNSFSPARSPNPNPNAFLTNGVIERDFHQKVAGQFLRPATASVPGDKSRSVSNEIRQTTLEPLLNTSKEKTRSSMSRKTLREADDVTRLQETSRDMTISKCEPEIPTPSETSLDTLLNCINLVLKKDDGLCDLEITPVRTRGRETIAEKAYQVITDASMPQSLHLEEVATSLDTPHRSQEANPLYLSPTGSLNPRDSDEEGDYGIPLEDNIARMLIGEIDLHFELENYLRSTGCFNPVRTRTRNTLQCNPCEDYRLSGVDLLSRTDENFDGNENRSSSSFTSASSVCDQRDRDKLQVYLDGDHDMGSTSEENFEAKNTKGFISQTQFSDKVGGMRNIKWDNDPKKKEYEIKSSIKRSFGKTSFQSLYQDEETSMAVTPFHTSHSMNDLTDSYEKIHPFRTSSKDFEETKGRGGYVLTKSENSLLAEPFSANIRKVESDSNGLKNTSERDGIELEVSAVTNKDGMVGTQSEYERKWSPSLQELIEIYNNVLKQNKRLRSNSRACVSQCVSSHLLAFLNEELKEKECKANLLMLSKTLHKKLKTPTMWKPGKQKKDNILAEYVSMFQEILNSSLTISQITRLNNVISGLQGISEKNYDIAKMWKASKKNKEVKKKEEALLNEAEAEVFSESEDLENNPVPPEYCPERLKKKYLIEKPVKAEKPASVKFQGIRKKPQRPKPKTSEGDTKVKKVELPTPTELEAMLKSYFISGATDKENQKESDDKILVTVQLSGNQVLVSGLSYFKNEKALAPRKADPNVTSELIIENVTKEEVQNVWCKPTRSSKLRAAKRLSDELEKPKSEIKIKPKIEQKKMKGSPKAPAAVPPRKQIKGKCASIDNLVIRAVEEPKSMVEFEYNQMQLRAQHPIEAIVESSESKISDHVESCEDDPATRNVVPPPEKKNPVKPIPKMKKLEEALKEALTDKVFSKDLTCDFGWNENLTEKSLIRTKSYMIGRETTHKEEVTTKKPHANIVRSLNDLKKNIKTRRKGRRVISSYVCYPSIVGLQEKYTSAKQKPKKPVKQKSRSVYLSSSRVSDNGLNNRQMGGNATSSNDVQPDVDVLQDSDPSGVNTVMGVNDVAPSCSSDLLYGDEGTSNNASPKVSTCTIKQNLQTSSEHLSHPIDPTTTNCSKASAVTVDTSNGSSIVIHAPKSDSDDMSFPSIMIHSDSFLKYYASLPPAAQSNWQPLFKSSSDMKFYPGRVNSSEAESGPLVKFVLTPSQNAAAELPANQVEVVDRKHVGEKGVNRRPQEKKASEEDINEKISLASIEKFIKTLAKNKKKETKFKPQVKEANAAIPIQKKSPQVGHRRTPPKPTDRKAYHECQKRKLTEKQKAENRKSKTAGPRTKSADCKTKTPDNKAKADDKVKIGKTTDGKTSKKAGTKTPEGKPESTKEQNKNSEINFEYLKSFIIIFSEMMETYQKYCMKSEAEKTDGESEEKTDVKMEEHQEKATNTNSEEGFSLTRIFDLAVDSSIRPLQTVKSANTQTEDWFSEGAKIEPKTADQPVFELQTCGDLCCPPKTSAEVLPHRKVKRLKIKIPCDDPKSKSADHNAASSAAEKPQQSTAQIGLLDSLVKRKSEVKVPEERIFLDATDDDSRTWSSKHQEFLAYWATVDLTKLSNGLVVEDSQRSLIQASLFPDNSFVEGSTEFLCEKILLSLRNGDICQSLGLLDDILHKAELSPESSDNSETLRNVLLLVISKSKSLMINLEKSAWIKVLNLLEEVHRMCEGSNSEEPERGFISNVLKLNDRRLLDLQNVCCSLSQWDINGRNGRFGAVVHRIVNLLKHLTNRLVVRRNRFAHSMHRAGTLPEVADDQNPLRRLRKEVQQRKRYMEFLMSADCGYIPQEVHDVKAKVVEKMRIFEKMFSVVREGCRGVENTAVTSGSPWGKAVSLLNFTRT